MPFSYFKTSDGEPALISRAAFCAGCISIFGQWSRSPQTANPLRMRMV